MKDTNKEYSFRKRGTYKGVAYDIKAHTEEELEEKYNKKINKIDGKNSGSGEYPYRKTGSYAGVNYDIKAHTEEELEKKYQKKIIAIERKHLTKGSSTTVNEWFDRYIEMYVDGYVTYQTQKDREGIYRRLIRPVIGSMAIGKVTSTECQSILNDMAGYSKDYIDSVAQLLYNIFRRAKTAKLIYDNPADDLARPAAVSGHGRAATMQERALMLLAAPKHRGGLWLRCILYLGMRPGETCRFLGKHINYDEGLVFVDGTKSAAARRIVPVPADLLSDLKDLNRKPNEHIFLNMHGDPLRKSSNDNMWHSFRNVMNITAGCKVYRNQVQDPVVAPDLIPYYFRHAFATDLKDANVPYRIRQELLGHSDGSVTDRYTHRTEKSLGTARDLLEKFRIEQQREIQALQQKILHDGYDAAAPVREDLTAKFFPDL